MLVEIVCRTKAFWSWCRDECASAPVLCGSTAAEYPVAERMVEMYPRRFTYVSEMDRNRIAILIRINDLKGSPLRRFQRRSGPANDGDLHQNGTQGDQWCSQIYERVHTRRWKVMEKFYVGNFGNCLQSGVVVSALTTD